LIPELSYKRLEKFQSRHYTVRPFLQSFNPHEALCISCEKGIKIPFILLTGNVSEEFAVNVLKRGADDYILKDRLERLATAIEMHSKKIVTKKNDKLSLMK
jgi:FixJ family two-component response regulator